MWRLKGSVLSFLLDQTGIVSQHRTLAHDDDPFDPEDEAWLREHLTQNLLCPDSLFALGCLSANESETAADWFLSAAFADTSEARFWIAALVASAGQANDRWHDIALCARRFCGDEIVNTLLETPQTIELAAEVQAVFDQLPEIEQPPLIIRIAEPNSANYVAIDLADRAEVAPGDVDESPR